MLKKYIGFKGTTLHIKTETIVGIFILSALALFFYMTFFLGFFRFDRLQYRPYIIYFSDVSGLEKKADVKIAGVKVGWIETIELVKNDPYKARAHIMLHKQYTLRKDAYAMVRQEGLLGVKYLELYPGDPLLPALTPGDTLSAPGKSPASIDEILHTVKDITSDVEDVTDSLQQTFGGSQGKYEVKTMFGNLQEAAESFAAFSSVIDKAVTHNEHTINHIISDVHEVTLSLKKAIPSIQESIVKISNRFDTDIAHVAQNLDHSIKTLEEAAIQAHEGFKNIGSITEKIDEGRGIVGKLINEDETYHDLKVTIQGLKKYFNKVDQLTIILDSHGEYMYRPAESVTFEDAKGYLEARIFTNEDHFYLIQYLLPQRGIVQRTLREVRWYDENCKEVVPSEFITPKIRAAFLPELVGNIEIRERLLDKPKIGVQIGKIYKNLEFRAGIFENSAGFGVDFDIPFNTDKFRWIVSFEAFDFKGRDRFDDKRPHLKWLNRVFILRNMYAVFGADDFISKDNANGFFGGGIRFCDDDIKYFLSQLSFAGFGGGN